jgi:hypothetical protein
MDRIFAGVDYHWFVREGHTISLSAHDSYGKFHLSMSLRLEGSSLLYNCSSLTTGLQNLHSHVRFEVFTAVTMNNSVFWDVTPCKSCVKRRLGGAYHLHLQLNLQPPAQAGSSLADFFTLKMEEIHSSETSVYTRSTQRHIPEDGILLTESWLLTNDCLLSHKEFSSINTFK